MSNWDCILHTLSSTITVVKILHFVFKVSNKFIYLCISTLDINGRSSLGHTMFQIPPSIFSTFFVIKSIMHEKLVLYLLYDDGFRFKFMSSTGGGTIYLNYRGKNDIPHTTVSPPKNCKPNKPNFEMFIDNLNVNLTTSKIISWNFISFLAILV